MDVLLVFLVVAATVTAVGFVAGLARMYRTFRATAPVVFRSAEYNGDHVANKNSVSILWEAGEDIEIYDDGNDFPESPYNSPQFIGALRRKLEERPGFKVRCLFNRDEPLKLKEEFAGHERVDIRVRESDVRPADLHYKIVDGGRRAYLSRHGLNDRSRKCRVVDCSGVKERDLALAADILFRNVRQDLADFRSIAGA